MQRSAWTRHTTPVAHGGRTASLPGRTLPHTPRCYGRDMLRQPAAWRPWLDVARRQTVMPAGPVQARHLLAALFIAALGLGLMAMAVLDARLLLDGWGTDRLHFGAAMFIQPWTTAFLLLVSGAVVHGPPASKTADRRLGLSLLITGALAVASVPGAYVAGAIVEGRLRAQGYTQCPNHAPGLRWRWDEWVRNGAPCRRNELEAGAGSRTPP